MRGEDGAGSPPAGQDWYVWFEDTSGDPAAPGGIAGLPECLLPAPRTGSPRTRIVSRSYVDGHWHLLSALRLHCADARSPYVTAVYLAALAAGTVALIGTGPQYAQIWAEAYG